MAAFVFASGLVGASVAVGASTMFDDRFPHVVAIDYTDCDPTCASGSAFDTTGPWETLLQVDPGRRRLYAYNRENFPVPRGIAVVDLDGLEQVDWIDLSGTKLANPASDRFDVIAHDQSRGRLFLGESGDTFGCTEWPLKSNQPHLQGCGRPGRIAVVDLTNPGIPPVVFSLRSLTDPSNSQFPAETSELDSIVALAYDDMADRLYVLTSAGRNFNTVGGIDPKGVAIVAFDGKDLSASSKPLWIYRPRACPTALPRKGNFGGPYFDAGYDGGSFVYFACRGTLLPTATQHGVVRVDLTPSEVADPTANFTTEFFPFAGNLNQGFSLGDPSADRIGIGVSGGGNQRFYVFDARRRAWVGSMLMGGTNTGGGGVDEGSGRMYVASAGEGLRFIDAAALPAVVLKTPIRLGFDVSILPQLAVDPITRRVAIPGPRFGAVNNHLWIYQDLIPSFEPVNARHPDHDTHDIEEGAAVQVSHTGFGSAYGAHAILVRGVTGVPLVSTLNTLLATNPNTAPFRLEGGDRGLFLSQVAGAELSGEADHGTASASAVATRLDEATASDLRGKSGELTRHLGTGEGEGCDPAAPGPGCLALETVTGNIGQLEPSACSDFGDVDDSKAAAAKGSRVECRQLERAHGWASHSDGQPSELGPVSFAVAHTETRVDVVKSPDGGVFATTTSLARGIRVDVPGLGGLTIGEVEATATSRAAGRKGTARTTLDFSAKNARIVDAGGATVFSCGVAGVGADTEDEGERCSPTNIALALNKYLAPRVQARGPRQELDPLVAGSPGGTRAIVTKDLYAYWNDATINGDAQREVTALDLTIYNDSDDASRVVLKLAGVYSEAQYIIGAPKSDELMGPTRLGIELADEVGEALAGGVFEVQKAGGGPLGLGGEVAAACVTTDDGVGDCTFDDLVPGDYVVSQTLAPAGYAPADPLEVTLEPGFETTAMFQNLRAIGTIAISISDDGGGEGVPAPLAGATFEVLADDGDLVRGPGDEPYGECTTGDDGACLFEEVPLGAYVVHQTVAPADYLLADDVGFVLELPGQVAELSFVTGLAGFDGEDPPVTPDEEVARDTAFVDAPTETTTVVITDPPFRPIAQVRTRPLAPSGLGRLLTLPGDAVRFLVRQPLQALLFALVWLLLATPAYLAVRRRTLTLAKGVV